MNVDTRLSRAGHALRNVSVDAPPLDAMSPARPSRLDHTMLVGLPAALLAVVVGLLAHATLSRGPAVDEAPVAEPATASEAVVWPSATEELELIRSLGAGRTEFVVWPSAVEELRLIGSLAANRAEATSAGPILGVDKPGNAL